MADTVPIVLLHGFAGSTRRTWEEAGWLDLLGDAGCAVHGIDLLGHGTADRPTDPIAYEQLESEVFADFPDGPADVISFSAGGRVALLLAAAHPDRFGRLVIAGLGENVFRERRAVPPTADGQPSADSETLAVAIAAGQSDGHPFMRWLSREAEEADVDREALVAFLRRPNPPELTSDVLAGVEAPVLLVMGDKDWAGPAEPLAEALPNASVVSLPGIDHFATPRSMAFMDASFDFLGIDP